MSRRSVPRDHHAGYSIPSNAVYRQHAYQVVREPNPDPGYDHRPLERADWGELVRMIPAAVVLVAGLWAFCALLAALVPG